MGFTEIDVVLLPRDLSPDLSNRVVVVFDVLRATTTMTAALSTGVSEIRIFDSIDSAKAAAKAFDGPMFLCGEQNCLAPAGFDLGNSPRAFTADHANKTLFMATTNGTRAILAARSAKVLFAGALVNATAVARVLAETKLNVLLLCAGTQGHVAMEDLLGCGAVIDALMKLTPTKLASDTAQLALRLFQSGHDQLSALLADSLGGRNVIAAGLAEDIKFAALLDRLNVVPRISDSPLRATL